MALFSLFCYSGLLLDFDCTFKERAVKSTKLVRLVKTPKETLVFEATARRAESEDDLLIDLEFYRKNGEIPPTPHYELELNTRVWVLPNPQFTHYHQNPFTHRIFVCWTGPIPTVEVAQLVFRDWCLVAAYGVDQGKDAIQFIREHDFDQFEAHVKSLGIQVLDE